GEDGYLVKLRTRDPEALGRVLREKILSIPSVRSTSTSVVLSTLKETSRIPLSNLDPDTLG
ncbi:MAG: Lrp/AsnC family transcriptional regulator, partial [Desulfobacterales bacterium]|nr:Lrp/AsnC family transcriptional regulator [Desulfobacterales bacterium]